MSTLRPVFLLSLPRSGSTLLQRLLMTHPAVSSVAEPWLLLPLFYALRETGHSAEYGEYTAQTAVNEFIRALPDSEDDYYAAVRNFAMELYAKAAEDGARYFVDKTPRYHLIVDELLRTFPDAKFIFLWRNPLAVIASIIQTWGRGRWNLRRFDVDLGRGLRNLMRGYRNSGDRSIAINYEALLAAPEDQLRRLWEYLDLEASQDALETFASMDVAGSMGDPTGAVDYATVTAEPIDKWMTVLNNPLRKAWCRRYLGSFSSEDWALIGYQRDQLLESLAATETDSRFLLSDAWRMAPGRAMPFRFKRNR